MSERFEVCWDWSEDGNVAHIAEHGVTPDQVEQVIKRGFADRQPNRSVRGRWIVEDFTDHGIFLTVSFELEWTDEWGTWAIYPVTAFESDE